LLKRDQVRQRLIEVNQRFRGKPQQLKRPLALAEVCVRVHQCDDRCPSRVFTDEPAGRLFFLGVHHRQATLDVAQPIQDPAGVQSHEWDEPSLAVIGDGPR
jgi:hypothetical protein